jgi:hypothetical protein
MSDNHHRPDNPFHPEYQSRLAERCRIEPYYEQRYSKRRPTSEKLSDHYKENDSYRFWNNYYKDYYHGQTQFYERYPWKF